MNPKKALRREWWLAAGFIIAIAVGALLPSYFSASEEYNAPDLSKKETLAEILDQAIGLDKIQYRGKRGEELRYAQNESAPYTGWVKVMFENGQVAHLFQFIDGKMHGIQTGWAKNGQKNYEVHFKENSQDGRVTAWWGHGQKMMEGQFVDGKLISAESWTLEGNANGKQVIDGNGKIRIERGSIRSVKFIPVENGVALIDSSGREDYLGKILYNRLLYSLLKKDKAGSGPRGMASRPMASETIWPLEKWPSWVTTLPMEAATPRVNQDHRKPEPQRRVEPKPRKPELVKTTPLPKIYTKKPKPKTSSKPKPRTQNTPKPRSVKVDTTAADKLRQNLQDKTQVNFRANSSTYNRYKDVVASVYQAKWNRGLPPKSASYRGKVIRVRVTVSKTGRVISARIVGRSGMVALDSSVQATLNAVRSIGQPFPPGVRESQQTFTINFQDKR